MPGPPHHSRTAPARLGRATTDPTPTAALMTSRPFSATGRSRPRTTSPGPTPTLPKPSGSRPLHVAERPMAGTPRHRPGVTILPHGSRMGPFRRIDSIPRRVSRPGRPSSQNRVQPSTMTLPTTSTPRTSQPATETGTTSTATGGRQCEPLTTRRSPPTETGIRVIETRALTWPRAGPVVTRPTSPIRSRCSRAMIRVQPCSMILSDRHAGPPVTATGFGRPSGECPGTHGGSPAG